MFKSISPLFLLVSFFLILFACQTEEGKNKVSEDTIIADSVKHIKQPEINIDTLATSRANILAAIPPIDTLAFRELMTLESTKKHFDAFDDGWSRLEQKYLSKIRTWRDQELQEISQRGQNLFYPFSGPDFLNAYNMFPDCDNYLMFGLERIGELPDFQENNKKYAEKYFENIRTALEDIFARNYFITSYMSSDLYKASKGVLPLVTIFLTRTGNQIVSIERIYLDDEGQPTYAGIEEKVDRSKLSGLMIEFLHKGKRKSQKLYYFGEDVSDAKMSKKIGLEKFIRSFPDKIAYMKSASYILFNPNFKTIKNIILEDVNGVLQDDTGIRYIDYVTSGDWDIQLYGTYARPIKDFGRYTFQPQLKKAFETDSTVKALSFPYGYHWRDNKASMLICLKKPQK